MTMIVRNYVAMSIAIQPLKLISDADIGFISPHFTMRESDGLVNIQVGVLSGSLQKEVTLNFFVTELSALGKKTPFI